jgi:hypothetical protein
MVVLGGVGGLTGGWENRGPEAAEIADGVEVVLAAGVPDGPTWTQPASIKKDRAATVSRTGE